MFFTKIYFRFGNLQKYTPAAQLPSGRDLAVRQRGGGGISEKKFTKNYAQVLGGRSPGLSHAPASVHAPQIKSGVVFYSLGAWTGPSWKVPERGLVGVDGLSKGQSCCA